METCFHLSGWFTNGSWNMNYLDTYPLPQLVSAVNQAIFSTKIPKGNKQSPLIFITIPRIIHSHSKTQECGSLLSQEKVRGLLFPKGKGMPPGQALNSSFHRNKNPLRIAALCRMGSLWPSFERRSWSHTGSISGMFTAYLCKKLICTSGLQ